MSGCKQLQFNWTVSDRQREVSVKYNEEAQPPLSRANLSSFSLKDQFSFALGEAARHVAEALASDRSIKGSFLDALAVKNFGHSAGHGRDIADAAEAGFNFHISRTGINLSDVPNAINQLLDLQSRMPTQTRRDANQVEWQQFSTPPAEALLLIKIACLSKGMTCLEPSAGTGNIAMLAHLTGADVTTNELDERRRQLLAWLGFAPTAFDAERLDNLLTAETKFDAVVMNPPFSATGGRVHGHSNRFGARHVEQALLRIKTGGRLVTILGRGMAMNRPGFQKWWREIHGRYRIRANIGIDGRAYAKFGTTFDHQIVVIDKLPPDGRRSELLTGTALTLHDAWKQLEHLSRDDVSNRVRKCSAIEDTRIVAARGFPAVTTTASSTDAKTKSLPIRSGPIAAGQLTTESPAAARNANRAVLKDVHCGHVSTTLVVDDPTKSNLPAGLSVESGSVYASYRVKKAIARVSQRHPANVVESIAMASVEPPDVVYRHHLPPDVIIEGRISDIQLEDVIYAGQATELFLPDGSRKGHWNGDGTGIGKGREIYAFILEQLQQGRCKHLHISASHQLVVDAERDRSAVGVSLPIIHQARMKPSQPILANTGIVFTTYTMLSIDFDGQRQRFKQLVEWLGPDFDGVIAFDEAHLMKNAAATPHGAKATVDHGTLRGNMGIMLQRTFPNARVRYFSATGATEPRHMAPYERLGLWGSGAPFADLSTFLVAMQRGGVAAMEMLCRDLKSVGSYLARTISYGPTRTTNGSILPESAVEYEPLRHNMSAVEQIQYNQIADLWSELLVAFECAEHNARQKRNSHRYAQFYAAQQRFFLQLMLAYTLPDVTPEIERDLKAGRSVVLSLFNTGEAQAGRAVSEALATGVELSELDATPREMVVQLIQTQFPLYQYREVTDHKTGNVLSVPVTDRDGNREINRVNQRRQEQLLEKVADLDFPHNPLDAMLAHFGAANVAEISGRTHRWENGKYVRRKLAGVSRRQLNEHETRLFQQGRKRIAVISGAGSTGISVHADATAGNQQRRVFYAFQLSWSADQQMQAFGRVHRSNQASAPIIRLVLLDLAGQKRLVNAVSKRLAALGALTKGERQSLSNDLFRPEDVTDEFGAAALARLYRQVERGEHTGVGLGLRELERMGVLNAEKTAVRDSVCRNVEQFLNRIMVLHVVAQNQIFELFYELYLRAVEAAKQAGAFDFGVEEIRARHLRSSSDPQTLFVDASSGARTVLHELEGDVEVERRRFHNAADSYATEGFHRNQQSGRIYAVAKHFEDPQKLVQLAGITGPRRSMDRTELFQKYEPVTYDVAKTWWEQEYEITAESEPRRYHILSGALFPIYDKIMGTSGIQNAKVARAILADGTAIVGLSLSASDVPNVKLRLGLEAPLASASADEILALLHRGTVIELDNSWQLTRRRIASDRVIELVLNGVAVSRDELRGYGLTEEIVRFKRRWFVAATEALGPLSRILECHKAIREVPGPKGAEQEAG